MDELYEQQRRNDAESRDWKLQQLAEKIKHDAQTGRAGQFFNVVTQKWEWPMPDNNGVRKLEYTGPVPAVPNLTVSEAVLSMVGMSDPRYAKYVSVHEKK